MSCQARDVFAGDPSLNVTGRLGSESWAHVLTISAVTVGDSPSRVFPASMEPAPHGVLLSCESAVAV